LPASFSAKNEIFSIFLRQIPFSGELKIEKYCVQHFYIPIFIIFAKKLQL